MLSDAKRAELARLSAAAYDAVRALDQAVEHAHRDAAFRSHDSTATARASGATNVAFMAMIAAHSTVITYLALPDGRDDAGRAEARGGDAVTVRKGCCDFCDRYPVLIAEGRKGGAICFSCATQAQTQLFAAARVPAADETKAERHALSLITE